MKRSYFVPLLIPAVFFILLAAVIGGVIGPGGVLRPNDADIRAYVNS